MHLSWGKAQTLLALTKIHKPSHSRLMPAANNLYFTVYFTHYIVCRIQRFVIQHDDFLRPFTAVDVYTLIIFTECGENCKELLWGEAEKRSGDLEKEKRERQEMKGLEWTK